MLQAYLNDSTKKDFYLNRVRKHREADELIQGTGWDNGRGCAVGCTLEEYNHSKYPTLLGVPEELARLQDRIFEALPRADALAFPESFLGAIPVGADLHLVWPKIALWVLTDEQHGVSRLVQDEKHKRQREAIENVAGLYLRWIAGDKPSVSEWQEARSAAYAAAAYAAYAAYAAAYAAYAADARLAFWRALRDQLLKELRAAPVAVKAS